MKNRFVLFTLFCLGLVSSAALAANSDGAPRVPAFPGAEGAGAFAQGGRGGRVLFVTTLDDYQPGKEPEIPGSLRAAVSARGPRIVLFRVAGNIDLKADLEIREPYITIAGQSAPGEGVCLMGSALGIYAHDVVLRYLRIRPGDVRRRELDGISCSARNVIIDHCSVSWAIDETLSTNGNSADVTVQWCLITESLNNSVHHDGAHGFGSLLSSPGEISYHHNVYAFHRSRNPRPGDMLLDFRNNVIYGWGDRAGYCANERLRMNYISNYLQPLGYSKTPEFAFSPGGLTPRFYLEGNHLAGQPVQTGSNWLLINPVPGVSAEETRRVLRADHAFPTALITTEPAQTAYNRILDEGGATKPTRDAVDARVIALMREGKGRLIDSQTEVGGWPKLASGALPPDADDDGLPDSWENRFGLSARDAADARSDSDGDGYSNLEELLNGTDPRQAEPWIAQPVVASTAGEFFLDSTTVSLACATPGAVIRYTLDETMPTESSLLYKTPFELGCSAVVRAVGFQNGRGGYVANAALTRLMMEEAVSVASVAAGLGYEYAEVAGRPQTVTWEALPVKTRGVMPQVTLAARERDGAFALRFRGYFRAPRTGIYIFYLRVSPLAQLRVGESVEVESEGRHSEHFGAMALGAGLHPIMFQTYYRSVDDMTLDVSFEGPGMSRRHLGPEFLVHALP